MTDDATPSLYSGYPFAKSEPPILLDGSQRWVDHDFVDR
jgi:hypothetical protein